MKALETLEKAKAIIADPKHWTKVHAARNADDKPVVFQDKDAICWCSVGAVAKAHGKPLGTHHHQATGLLDQAARDLGYKGAIELNDAANHGTVMQMFDLAIGLAKEKSNA